MVSIPPGSSLGRYRLVEQVGRGGMATVYRAHDPNLDRFIAIKVLPSFHTEDPTFVARFTREAQTVARLNHSNILQIYDFGEDKGFSYLVSELVTGGTLEDRLGGPLTVDQALRFIGPLADALDYAHAHSVIHRDIKPSNVLLDEQSKPILADFGLAQMLESAIRFTQVSQAIGTPEYMSPEQAMGAEVDHRADLYALGIILYQLLLGQTPFHADTPAATLMAHVHLPLPLPSTLDPDIDPRLETTLLKATAKTPDDRFRTAGAMVEAVSLAAGRARVVDTAGPGDTTQMDTIDLAATDETAADTALVAPATESPPTTPTETPPRPEAPPASAKPAEEAAPPRCRWLIGGGAAAVVVAVAVIGGIVALSGDGDEEDGPGGTPLAAAAPVDAATPTATPPPPTTTPLAAALVDAATPTPATPTPPPPAATPALTLAEALATLEKLTARTEENVVTLRKLTPDAEIETQLRTRDQLASITRGFFRRDALRRQVFEAQELYKVLGLMDEDLDLEEILVGIQLQQVYALFDDETEVVYVLSDVTNIGPVEELGYASAYMGGLQQQHFEISTMRREARQAGADRFRAVNALIGGDVTQAALGYIQTVFTSEQLVELQKPLPENLLLAAPKVIQKTVLFPQREGADFIAALFGMSDAGWDGVDTAYSRPPESTEQVLQPELYLVGEAPQPTLVPSLAAELGRGWVEVSNDTMGEFLLRVYLEEYLDEIQAADAAAGWGGDKYSLLSGPEGERVLVLMTAWDSPQDASEFSDAYQVFVGVKTQGQGATSSNIGDTGRKWIAPDQAIFLGRVGPNIVLIVISDDDDLLGRTLDLVVDALDTSGP